MINTNTPISDIVSMSAGLLYVIPFALFYITGNNIHFRAFLGVAATTLISETLKYNVFNKISTRPQGATNCNALCNDGNQSGRPGMPSSHSAQVAFFTSFYFQQTENVAIRCVLILYLVGVMASRYIKRCHTLGQIVGGGVLGFILSLFAVRQ